MAVPPPRPAPGTGRPYLYLIVDAAGRLDSTHLVGDWDGLAAVRGHAETIGGLVAAIPIVDDFRRP